MRTTIYYLMMIFALGGCQQRGSDPATDTGQTHVSDSIAAVHEPMARAEVRREIAAQDIESTDREVAKRQLNEQKRDLADAKTALQEAKTIAQTQLDQSEGRRQVEVANVLAANAATTVAIEATTQIESQWYVQWGRRIDATINVIKWSVVSLIILTIATSALKGMSGPAGMIGSFVYGLCLTIWTFGTYLIGRLFRWGRERIGGANDANTI